MVVVGLNQSQVARLRPHDRLNREMRLQGRGRFGL